jgi:hypothetical protein
MSASSQRDVPQPPRRLPCVYSTTPRHENALHMEAARIVNSKQQRFGTNLFFDIGAKLARLDPLMRGLSVKIVPRK